MTFLLRLHSVLKSPHPRCLLDIGQADGGALARFRVSSCGAGKAAAARPGVSLRTARCLGRPAARVGSEGPLLSNLDGDHLRTAVREALANLSGFDRLLQLQPASLATLALLLWITFVDIGHINHID